VLCGQVQNNQLNEDPEGGSEFKLTNRIRCVPVFSLKIEVNNFRNTPC
jgi:hypothetical protein